MLESRVAEGESPVGEKSRTSLSVIPSNAGHVKPRVNLRRPLRKAKYYLATDSAPVA